MFSKEELKRNLLGCLEVALFMPIARQRFANSYDEAVRSFIIPILLFPLSLASVYLFPQEQIVGTSANTIALLYSLRIAASWALFLSAVYMIVREIDRRDLFYKFIVASNWITLPATLVFVPVGWMLMSGLYTWQELYPFMACLMLYSYAFTAFMVAYVLRVPWELAGFITFIGVMVNDNTMDAVHWLTDKL
ncbi:MAG: hypothetical protein KKA05_01485 [Alphaproteobacteria bacterium]|nr:hypothetical protein [Alphaproteobacteria bacterium]MBU0858436.1 hypothetical protein [Alphaproteobacteria bacterium]